MNKYTKPYVEGMIFVSSEDFINLLEQADYDNTLVAQLEAIHASGARKNFSTNKYIKGIFVSLEDFIFLLDQADYNSMLFAQLEVIIKTSFHSLTAQLPKEQVILLVKLEEIQQRNLDQRKKDQD